MKIDNVLLKPRITEKALGKTDGTVYTFEVSTDSNKDQIRHRVEEIFNVKVSEVKTLTKKGKVKRTGRQRNHLKTQPSRKIAYVKVTTGKIDLFPKA